MESDKVSDSNANGHEKPGKPYKFLVTDLAASKSLSNGLWQLNISSKHNKAKMVQLVHDGTVWIQGTVVQTTPLSTIVLEDDTGKAQITYSTLVDEPMAWIKKGAYCLVIGKLLNVSSIPTVSAMKLSCLDTNTIHKPMWRMEVEEVKYLLTNQIKITPRP